MTIRPSSFARRLLGEADLPQADTGAIKGAITTRLVAAGWTQLDPARHSAVAEKEYDTAVGPRVAVAYVQPFGPDSVMLQGSYDSEGRNVLDTRGVIVPLNATEAALDQAVQSFVAKADEGVDASYARGLHVRHGIRAESLPPGSEAHELHNEDLLAAAEFAEALLREDGELVVPDKRQRPQIFSIPPRDEDEGTEYGDAQWFVGRFKPEGGVEQLSDLTTDREQAVMELRALLAKPVEPEEINAPQLPRGESVRNR